MAEKKAARRKPAPAAAAAAPTPREDASPARVASVKLVPRQVTVLRRQEEDWDAELAREPPRPPFRLRTRPRASNPRPPAPVAANGQGHARSRISIQVSQHGNDPLRWDRSGVVVEVGEYDSYSVRLDGSGRLSKRNRTHLRPVQAHDDDDAAHFPLATLPDFIAQGARPRTRAAPPPAATPPTPPPDATVALPLPDPLPATPPPAPAPTPPPDAAVALPLPDPLPATPPAAPAPTPAPEPAPAPRRNPPRDRRAPQRLLEHCAVAYRNGDLELADDIIDCVVGMLRFQ